MEHRANKRIARSFNVILHEKGNSLIDGRLRDISSNGMYIELDSEQKINEGCEVRVAFKTGFGLHIVHSEVIRAEPSGSAMVFTRKDDRLDAALARMTGEEGMSVPTQ